MENYTPNSGDKMSNIDNKLKKKKIINGRFLGKIQNVVVSTGETEFIYERLKHQSIKLKTN